MSRLNLRGNYPNPFKPQTRLVFELSSSEQVLPPVFDPGGRLVRTLVDEIMPAGLHATIWQAEDGQGRRVPSGACLYQLQTGERVATRTARLIE